MKSFTFAMPQQQKDRLREMKRLTGLAYAEIMRRALDQYLSQREMTLTS